jgi:DNA-binding transcriptional regulator YhcF (GntR family)
MELKIDENSLTPIYIQIADAIEEDILNNKLIEESTCYSQLIIAKELKVNPATAAKGINLLVSRTILEKQRGQAMTVTLGAKAKIMERKKQTDFEDKIDEIVRIAKRLELSESYVLNKISEYYKEER